MLIVVIIIVGLAFFIVTRAINQRHARQIDAGWQTLDEVGAYRLRIDNSGWLIRNLSNDFTFVPDAKGDWQLPVEENK